MLPWLVDQCSSWTESFFVCPNTAVCQALRATGVALGAMVITFLVGFLVLSDVARRQYEGELRDVDMQASMWGATLESYIVNISSVADTLAGFVTGGAKNVPNHSGTIAQRTADVINPTAFRVLAQRLIRKNLGLLSLEIHPSGVINQVYPEDRSVIGYDLYNDPDARADILNLIAFGGTGLAGPLALVQGGKGLVMRSPVYLGLNNSLADWWGDAVAVMTLDGFINSTNLWDLPAQGYHFQLQHLDSEGRIQVIVTSDPAMDVAAAVSVPVRHPDGVCWYLFLMPVNGWNSGLKPSTIIAVSVSGFFGGLLTAALYYMAYWFVSRHQRNVSSAPTAPPVLVIFTDIESSTHLWHCHPQAMQQALLLHNRIIRRLIKAFGAYEVKTLGDSFMIACRTTRAALDLCLAIQRELRAERKWPEEVEEFYGSGDRWLKVRMGAHRCLNVQCLFDEVSKGYDYIGNDINKCARIESVAAGGEILLSDELATEARQLGEYQITCVGEKVLRGFKEAQVLHRLVLECSASSPHMTRHHSWFGVEPHAATHHPANNSSLSFTRSPGVTGEDRVEALVQEYREVSAEDLDADQLLTWVRLLCQVLRLLLDNLPKAARGEVLRQVCEAWGVKASNNNRVPCLALSLARLLLVRYPHAFPSGIVHGMTSFITPRHTFPSRLSEHSGLDNLRGATCFVEAASDVSELNCPVPVEVPELPRPGQPPHRSVRLAPCVSISPCD
eukprot:GGOE01021097.1.p1 GENE.GGOE01021097.1~~GGOE01021097.1.p1  ORF type:complete len:729 (+),score=202.17 GGOE01021097.1:77-2263(+)